MAGRRTGQMVTFQVQTIPGLTLTSRYICDCMTHSKLAITRVCVCVCVFHSSYVLFPISCAYGMCPLRRVTSSHWASGTSAWRLRMCVSLITWRCTTALILELGECWGGEIHICNNFTVASCVLRVKKKCVTPYGSYITTVFWSSFCLPQVLWYHLPSGPDLLGTPHDCGVRGWWGSGRQRLQRNIPGCVRTGQWVLAIVNRDHILSKSYWCLSFPSDLFYFLSLLFLFPPCVKYYLFLTIFLSSLT